MWLLIEMAGEGRFQRRGARLLLLLTIVHTVPVVWITPVAGGTAPIAALLAFAFASLLTFDSEGVALGLIALAPGLLYMAVAWILAWLLVNAIGRLSRSLRLVLLAMLVVVPLLAVYFPIYIAGGHNSSSSVSLVELLGAYVNDSTALTYWIVLHAVLAVLYAAQFPAEHSPQIVFAERWTKPVLGLVAVALSCTIVYSYYPQLVCRPLAELGNGAAQLCVAESDSLQARYWYERAAADGNGEAIAWLINNTPNRRIRLEWLRKGAQAGHPAIQYQLAQHLRRFGDSASQAEAALWLEAAVAGNYGPAQQEIVERLTLEVLRTKSRELLSERNALLEQAAQNGSRLARQRLAEHYARGSMGYPADMKRARTYYEELANSDATAETVLTMSRASYGARLDEINAWQAGLAAEDPAVILELAKVYLGNPLPGPGVHELGLQLFERIAAVDPSARQELIFLLRTGSGGADKDLTAAKRWLLKAAQAGEVDAMDRVARNYMGGHEGFPVDYPEARFWIGALIEHYQRAGGADVQARITNLEDQLAYINRLEGLAGGTLLGASDLENLARENDAESQFRYALQLLAGHGAARRAEAVSRLQTAAELGHAEAAWRLVWIYERGFPEEINEPAARRELERAVQQHHFKATRELASRYEYGNEGYHQDLPRAIEMYESALAAGRDNRYDWQLDPDNYNHFRWLESRLRQARLKLNAKAATNAN